MEANVRFMENGKGRAIVCLKECLHARCGNEKLCRRCRSGRINRIDVARFFQNDLDSPAFARAHIRMKLQQHRSVCRQPQGRIKYACRSGAIERRESVCERTIAGRGEKKLLQIRISGRAVVCKRDGADQLVMIRRRRQLKSCNGAIAAKKDGI